MDIGQSPPTWPPSEISCLACGPDQGSRGGRHSKPAGQRQHKPQGQTAPQRHALVKAQCGCRGVYPIGRQMSNRMDHPGLLTKQHAGKANRGPVNGGLRGMANGPNLGAVRGHKPNCQLAAPGLGRAQGLSGFNGIKTGTLSGLFYRVSGRKTGSRSSLQSIHWID